MEKVKNQKNHFPTKSNLLFNLTHKLKLAWKLIIAYTVPGMQEIIA